MQFNKYTHTHTHTHTRDDGNGDDDGNGHGSGDGLGEGEGEAKKREKPHKSRKHHVGNRGDLGRKRRKRRVQERVGSEAAKPDNLENRREAWREHKVPKA